MKKNYISPEILVLNANIMSELLSGSGSGNGSANYGGGGNGDEDQESNEITKTGNGEFVLGSKGDSWSSWDD